MKRPAPALLLFFAAACSDSAATSDAGTSTNEIVGCKNDLECKGDRICDPVMRVCVDPGGVHPDATASSSSDTGVPDPADTGVASTDTGAASMDSGAPRDAGPVDSGFDQGEGPTCGHYCRHIFEACTGPYSIYDNAQECMSLCSTFPLTGMMGDRTGNSLFCRISFSEMAAVPNPATPCGRASVHGGGTCGSYCDVYCDLVGSYCHVSGDPAFATRQACMTACAMFPTNGAFNARTGNHVQCRILQAAKASGPDPATACTNAAPTPPMGSPCR